MESTGTESVIVGEWAEGVMVVVSCTDGKRSTSSLEFVPWTKLPQRGRSPRRGSLDLERSHAKFRWRERQGLKNASPEDLQVPSDRCEETLKRIVLRLRDS